MNRRNAVLSWPSLLLALALCLASSLALHAAPPACSPPPDSPAIRQAEALGREGSWAAARKAYAALLGQSPSPADARWLELWLIDTTWRSEEIPNQWQAREAWLKAKRDAFSSLLAPYAKPEERDEFWLKAKQSELALTAKTEPYNWTYRLSGLLDVADYLGTQPASPTTAQRYIGALRELAGGDNREPGSRPLTNVSALSGSEFAQSILTLFSRASANPAFAPDDRAWCALMAAQVSPKPTPATAATVWAAAIEATRGTRWESVARADAFAARARVGYDPSAKPGTAADLPALLETLNQLKRELPPLSNQPEAREAAADLDQIAKVWTMPALLLDCPNRFSPTESVKVGYGVSGYYSLRFMLYKVDADTWLGAPRTELKGQDGLETFMAKQHLVRSWLVTLPDPSSLKWSSALEPVADRLDAGYYVLSVIAWNPKDTKVWLLPFLSTDLFVSAATLGDHTQAQLLQMPGFTPLANQDLELEIHTDGSQTIHSHLRSNATGAVSFSMPAASGFARRTTLLSVKGQPAVLMIYQGNQPNFRMLADVFTERPLYRPGETAHWKVILRERVNGQWRAPGQNPVLKVKLGEDDLPIQASRVDAFGAVSGKVSVPADAKPGRVQLLLTFEDHEGRKAPETVDLFRVDNFQPPPVQVRLALVGPRTLLHPGGELTLSVGAEFFSGGAVPEAAVELKVDPMAPWQAEDREQKQIAAWQSEIASKTFRLTTDSDGQAVFRLPLPSFLSNATVLRVTATISVPGVAPVTQSAVYTVYRASVCRADPSDRPALAEPGRNVHFSTRLLAGDGQPCALDATVRLFETTWTEAWLDPEGKVIVGHHHEPTVQRGSDPSSSDSHWKQLVGEYHRALVAEKSVHVGDDGRLSTDFVLPREGRYEIECLNGDSVIEAAHAIRWSQTAGKTVIFAARSANPELSIDPAASALATDTPEPGASSLRVLVVLPEGNHTAVLNLNGETTLTSLAVHPKGRAALVKLALTKESVSTLRLSLLPVDRRSMMTSVEIPLPEVTGLKAGLQLPAAPIRPGSPTQVGLGIAGLRQSEEASAALAVSDDAVFSLSSDSSALETLFARAVQPAHVSNAMSAGLEHTPSVVRDPRPGAMLNPTRWGNDMLTLDAFSVEADRANGYGAANILAGTRMRGGIAMQMAQKAPAGFFGGKASDAPPEITVRRHFGLTAFWAPDLRPDAKGHVEASFTLPDSLTRWRVSAYVLGSDPNDFAVASGTFQASLPFQARLQLPATLVAGDSLQAGALLVNRSSAAVTAQAELQAQGPLSLDNTTPASVANIAIPAEGDARRSWLLHASAPGETTLTLRARAGTESDGMESMLRILEDGIDQPLASASVLEPKAAECSFNLPLPTPLDKARTQVSLDLTPSLAGAALDALPYLVDYPYGCVEQTMNRFLPAVVVKHTLVDLGLDAAQVEHRILARTHRAAPAGAGLPKLDDVIAESLKRLSDAQRSDGSFGWWPGSPYADNWMTAYVVWGLQLASDSGVDVPSHVASSARNAVIQALPHEMDSMRTAWMLAALSLAKERTGTEKALGRETFARCLAEREHLPASGRACLALASAAFGSDSDRALLLRNLENGAIRSSATGQGESAQWGIGQGCWRAEEGAVESTALTLLALLRLEPTNPLCPAAARWLVLNRRSDGWSNTRDTAFAVLALTRYLSQQERKTLGATVDVLVNGRAVSTEILTADSLLAGPTRLTLTPDLLVPGANTITLTRRAGSGPVYVVALAKAWATGDGVRPEGHLLQVSRDATRFAARSTLAGNLLVVPEPIAQGAVKAGEQVELAVRLTAPHDFDYVKVEIPKPAGCEPVNPLSGWDATLEPAEPTGHAAPTRTLYRAQFDDRSVVFIDRLPAGEWILRLRLRAVLAGDFRLLPAQAQAMYVPEICGNSDSKRVRISE